MTTVYIPLTDEDVNVWRPVQAEHVGGDLYRLTGQPPDGETWAFVFGDVVRCKPQALSGGGSPAELVLVAYEKAARNWDSIPSSLRWTE